MKVVFAGASYAFQYTWQPMHNRTHMFMFMLDRLHKCTPRGSQNQVFVLGFDQTIL